MKKRTILMLILIWVILASLTFAITYSRAKNEAVYCWDGLKIDEPLLMELCGITKEEYYSGDFVDEDCPEAWDAITMVGDCETDWPVVRSIITRVMIIFFAVSAVGFLILWLVNRLR